MRRLSPRLRTTVLLALTLLFASGAVFIIWRASAGRPGAQPAPPLPFNKRAAIAIDTGASRDRVDAALVRVVREAPDYEQIAPEMQDALLQQALPLATFTFTRSFDEYMALIESLGGGFKPSRNLMPEHIKNIRAQWEDKNWRSVDTSNAQFWLRRRDGDYPRFSARHGTQATSGYDFGLDDDMWGSKKSAMVQNGAPVIYLTIPMERTAPSGDPVVEHLRFSFVWDANRTLWLPYTVAAYSDDRPRSVFF